MNSAAGAGDFLVTSPANALFVLGCAGGRENEMRMRINEARQNDAPAEVKFTRVASFAEAFNAAARVDRGDASVANQQRTIANDAQIGERLSTARRGSPQSEKFSAASDENIFSPRKR